MAVTSDDGLLPDLPRIFDLLVTTPGLFIASSTTITRELDSDIAYRHCNAGAILIGLTNRQPAKHDQYVIVRMVFFEKSSKRGKNLWNIYGQITKLTDPMAFFDLILTINANPTTRLAV